jgi:hypothetical protein
MSLKQICFVSVLFSDDKDEPADPNIILEEPDDEASNLEPNCQLAVTFLNLV